MGYMTDYEVEAGPFETEEAAEFFEFKAQKTIGYSIDVSISPSMNGRYFVTFELNDAKWYNWGNDLEALSRAFPNITIDVEGDGEETGDQWKARFRNGSYEKVEAIVTFPDFTTLTD